MECHSGDGNSLLILLLMISIYYSPKAVLKRNSSPSRQNTSHTLLATSSGRDLLYSVNILENHTKYIHEHISFKFLLTLIDFRGQSTNAKVE